VDQQHRQRLRYCSPARFRLRGVNTHLPLIGEMPRRGCKHSGYGKDLSMYGLEGYTRIKHVMIHHGFEG
jgi:acyl-CoA reductase-like NAD-dependent aldehyde dehydrogenase